MHSLGAANGVHEVLCFECDAVVFEQCVVVRCKHVGFSDKRLFAPASGRQDVVFVSVSRAREQ